MDKVIQRLGLLNPDSVSEVEQVRDDSISIIKEMLAERGCTQVQLASDIGITAPELCNILAGHRKLAYRVIKNLIAIGKATEESTQGEHDGLY